MVSEHGQDAMERRTKRESSRRIAGPDLVAGIATVVVVGVAGKLFSMLRKPNGAATVTATDSLGKIINADGQPSALLKKEVSNGENDPNDELPEGLSGENLSPPSEALINGEKASSMQTNKASCGDAGGTFAQKNSNLASAMLTVSPGNAASTFGNPDPLSISHIKDLEFATGTPLSELVNHALSDSKHDTQSKTDLLVKAEALHGEIADVISRAFEDFGCGDLSGDELEPTKLKLRVTVESVSDSDEAGADADPDSANNSDHITSNLRDSVDGESTAPSTDGYQLDSSEEEAHVVSNSTDSVGGEPVASSTDGPQLDSSEAGADMQVHRIKELPVMFTDEQVLSDSLDSICAPPSTDSSKVEPVSPPTPACVPAEVEEQSTEVALALAPSFEVLCSTFVRSKEDEVEATPATGPDGWTCEHPSASLSDGNCSPEAQEEYQQEELNSATSESPVPEVASQEEASAPKGNFTDKETETSAMPDDPTRESEKKTISLEVDLAAGARAGTSVKMTSLLLPSTDATSATEVTTLATKLVDGGEVIQRSTVAAGGQPTAAAMAKALPHPSASSYTVSNVTEVLATTGSGTRKTTTAVMTKFELTAPLASSKDGVVRDRLPLELFRAAALIALIAFIVWAVHERMTVHHTLVV